MKSVRKWISVLAVMFCITACQKSGTANIQEQMDLGQKYLAEGNYEEAIIAFQKVIELEPHNMDVYMQLADLYMNIGNRELAFQNYTVGYQNGTESEKEELLERVLHLAEVNLEEGNNDLSNFYYDLILELNESASEALLGKVYVLIQEEQFDEAYEILKEKVKEVPEDRSITKKLSEFNVGKIKDYKGRVAKEMWFNEDGTLHSYTINSYNDLENRVTIQYYNADNTLASVESIYRDKDGERIKSVRYAGEGYLMMEGSRQKNGRWRNVCYNSDGSIDYIEDSEDRSWTYDANGNLTMYSVKERNEQGQVVKWNHYTGNGELLGLLFIRI